MTELELERGLRVGDRVRGRGGARRNGVKPAGRVRALQPDRVWTYGRSRRVVWAIVELEDGSGLRSIDSAQLVVVGEAGDTVEHGNAVQA